MDKQIKFMRKLIADLVADARLHKTSMASIVGNGNFVAEQIMNDVYNQALEDLQKRIDEEYYDGGYGDYHEVAMIVRMIEQMKR